MPFLSAVTVMGGKIVRAFRNFNVESRAHKLIGKAKPRPAPMHPSTREAIQATTSTHPDIQVKMYKKDGELLSRLKDVYVDSTDPSPQLKPRVPLPKHDDWRPPKHNMSYEYLGVEVDNIPKGKISIVEALTILGNHKNSPETWTAEKVAGEYSLDIKDTKAMLEFFSPFEMELIPSNNKEKIDDK